MDQTLDELKAKGDQALIDFLKGDLDLGFSFLRLARIEKGLDEPASDRAKHNVAKVIKTVKHLEPRMNDDEQAQEIRERLQELERLVSAL